MPSLKVNTQLRCKSTYHHFYESLSVDRINNHMQYPIAFNSFVSCLLHSICILFCLFSIYYLLWEYLESFYTNWYDTNQVYLYDGITTVILCFISSTITIHLFFSHKTQIPQWRITIISLILFFIINCPTLVLLSIQFHNNINKSKQYILSFICDTNIFDTLCDTYFSWYYVYLFCFCQPIYLFILIIIQLRLNMYENNDRNKQETEFELGLLTNDSNHDQSNNNNLRLMMISQNDGDITMKPGISQVYDNDNKKGMLATTTKNTENLNQNEAIVAKNNDNRYYVLFGIIWIVYVWIMYIFHIERNFDSNRIHYYGLLILTTFFKITLKRIARQIDISAVTRLHLNGSNMTTATGIDSRVSFELVCELIVSFNYYVLFYILFIFELSLIDDVSLFLEITTLHVLSEIFQSLIRLSKIYFQFANIVYNQVNGVYLSANERLLVSESNLAKCQRFLCDMIIGGIILKYFKDDSTFDEWRVRHSLDLTLRIIALITCVVCVLGYLIIDGYAIDGIESKFEYNRSLLYLAISLGVDVLYFILLWIYQYFRYDFNFCKPILILFVVNTRAFYCMLMVSFLLSCVLFV